MKYQHFNLQETMGLSEPLKEGYVIYRLGDKKVSFKSLYVPGVGWCPITKELSEDFTNIPKGLALYCPIDAKDDDIKSWIGKSSSITLYGDVGWYSIPSIRFRVDLESQVLFLTPSDKKKDFEEYDRLQILLSVR